MDQGLIKCLGSPDEENFRKVNFIEEGDYTFLPWQQKKGVNGS